ncbi:MAG: tyrosine--tRNA ligase [Candidatus Nealsonbacteria bacterium]
MKPVTDPQKIKEALTRGVDSILPSFSGLEKILLSGKRIRIYCGYDPSTPFLHIGHAITLKKLSHFQKLGHEIIMLIGDFTGMIGDPTEKAATRKKLTRQEVLRNAESYKKTAGKIIDFEGENPAKVLFNSKWNDELTFADLIELSSNFTVQQMMARDMFQERIKNKKPVFLHEFLYPLAQAYDSLAMDIDLEIGGKDQTFNMLCGRDLMKILKKKDKFILTTKLLIDPAGKKMGKTEGNIVKMNEKPENMYGKIMAWPDEMIALGFELCTDTPLEKIKENNLNPRDLKAILAKEIVTIFHNKKEAEKAEQEFNRVFKEKKEPLIVPKLRLKEGVFDILDLLNKTGLIFSKAEAKRLIKQKGVKINNSLKEDWKEKIKIRKGDVIQIGKRRFLKII